MSARAEPLLAVNELSFRYDDKRVLDRCTFFVEPAERLAILGTSGCGKSTLLRLILGLIQPDEGSILFDDRDIPKIPSDELNVVRQKIGMVFQNAALISSISVEDNLALPLTELTNKPREEVDKIIDEKLRLVGMTDVKDKLPAELSGGMRKRVGIARALVLEPKLVLFDEPSSGLDPVGTALIDELILGLGASETTCVVVTHNLDSAFRIATRVAMLHDGAILEEGPTEEFRRSKNPIVRQFVSGDPKGPLSEEPKHEPSKR